MNNIAYLDNNATTLMPESVVQELVRWSNQGNPSAAYASAKRCQTMMEEFRGFIARSAGAPIGQYVIVFTSGATEANCMICRAVIERARTTSATGGRTGAPFHVVTSAIEHKSILLLLEDMARCIPEMNLTLVNPDASGHIRADDFVRALRPTTCLAICMNANNETGAINDIADIGRVVKAFNPNIFFHSDIVQSFGKIPVRLDAAQVDGASISFHKLHGPPGVGAAIIRKSRTKDWCPILYGTQSSGMRGGTENVIGIGAAYAATQLTFSRMQQTIEHELGLKKYLVARLANSAPTMSFEEYIGAKTKMELQIVLIGDKTFLDPARYLPATIMISATKLVGPSACNTLIKEKLEAARVIVSVGSACNTSSQEHSHVLRSMGLPTEVMDGAIRVSMCGYTTREEIDRFILGFLGEVKRQYTIRGK